jgi:DNA repair and recombination protein RAD52
MTQFNAEQVESLKAPLDPSKVSERTQMGMKLSYIEGWHVIAEANRIFGFDGWQRETVELREVRLPELVKSSSGKETWRVGFMCRVRVTVGGIVRDGTGFGSGAMPDLGDAYESAVKEAETDAMKRAFMTFGNPFGLALYDKTRANVGKPFQTSAQMKRDLQTLDADLVDCRTEVSLTALWKTWAAKMNMDNWPPAEDDDETAYRNVVKDRFRARKMAISAETETIPENLLMAG